MQSTDRSGAQVEGTGGVGARVFTLMALETLHGNLFVPAAAESLELDASFEISRMNMT